MEVRISVSNGNLADLESLADWLRGEPELAGRVKLTGQAPPAGTMGAPWEEIAIAALSSGTVTALITSLKAWLPLPRKSHVRIKLNKAGRVTEIDADLDPKRAESLIREALESGTPKE